ncbi:MAG: CDP-alcohol phosphatidyltransferase family protein [Nanoarchaeota archaeon]
MAKETSKKYKQEKFLNVPNSLTLLRLLLTFIIIYMLFTGISRVWVVAIFIIAAMSDYFDGIFARKLKQTTRIGARMDQAVDRVFTISIIIVLLFLALNSPDKIEQLWLLFLVSSREIFGLPGFLISIIRGVDTYRVKFIGKITMWVESIALGAIILEASFVWYLAVPAFVIGAIAGLDYTLDSVK